MGCVYLVENTVNRKCYIGKTIGTLEHRKRCHYTDSKHRNTNVVFYNALRKYGRKDFVWIKLYESDNNEKLIEKEIYFIKKYKTKSPHGYNLTNGGDGTVGYIYSKASKKKMSKAQKGKIHPHSEETKRKISESHKGISINLGRPRSKKTKEKISRTLMGHFVSDVTKRKISKALKGKPRGW